MTGPALPDIPDIAAWWDSTEGLSASAWIDRTGNGNDLSPVGAPSIIGNGLNGHDVARFVPSWVSGSDDVQAFAGSLAAPFNGNPMPQVSMWVLLRVRSRQDAASYICVGSPTGYSFCLSESNAGVGSEGWYTEYFGVPPSAAYVATDFTLPLLTVDSWYLVEAVADADTGESDGLIDGTAATTQSPGSDVSGNPMSPTTATVGSFDSTDGTYALHGDVAAAGFCSGLISAADRAKLYAWVNAVYGLDLPLPASGPPGGSLRMAIGVGIGIGIG